jgi:hypothetical protein
MKKMAREGSKKKENIVAVLLGLVTIVIGVPLIVLLLYFSYDQVSQSAQHAFPKANLNMTFPDKWSEEQKTVLRETASYVYLSSSLYAVIATILGLLLLKIFAFSGWVVIKIATNKSWYMAGVPATIVLLTVMFIFPDGIYGYALIDRIVFLLLLLLSLVGGWVAKHIQIK